MKINWKRSWENHILWLLFTICTFFFVVQAADQTGTRLGAVDSTLTKSGFVVFLLVVFGFSGALVYYVSSALGKIQPGKLLRIFIETIFWLFIVISFGFRYIYQQNWWSLLNPLAPPDRSLLDQALIGSGDAGRQALSSLSAFYVDILSFLFSFLGNKETIVFYFQLLLQMITILFLYFTVKILCGKIAAYVLGVILASSTQWIEASMQYQPEVIYMFLWSFALFLIAVCYASAPSENELSPQTKRVLLLGIGALCGALIWFDLLGILLIPVLLYLLFTRQNTPKVPPIWNKTLFLTAGIILGVFIMLFREAVLKSNTVGDNIQNWITRYPAAISAGIHIPAEQFAIQFILAMFTCFLIVAYLQDGKWNVSFWIFDMLLLSAAAPSLGLVILNHQLWLTLIWGILAGTGLQKMLKLGMAAGGHRKTRKANPINLLPSVGMTIEKTKQSDKTDIPEIPETVRPAAINIAPQTTTALAESDTAYQPATEPAEPDMANQPITEPISSEIEINRSTAEIVAANKIIDKIEDKTEEIIETKANSTEVETNIPVASSDNTESILKNTEKDSETATELKSERSNQTEKTEETSRYDTSKGTKYIDNPLPLPPKPVRKGMDYPYKVPPEKMHYDIEVSPTDDYEHKRSIKKR